MENSDIQRIEHIKHYCEDIKKSIVRFLSIIEKC